MVEYIKLSEHCYLCTSIFISLLFIILTFDRMNKLLENKTYYLLGKGDPKPKFEMRVIKDFGANFCFRTYYTFTQNLLIGLFRLFSILYFKRKCFKVQNLKIRYSEYFQLFSVTVSKKKKYK